MTDPAPTTFYIRTADGDTRYVDTLGEALRELTGPNGYRLTVQQGDDLIVIRAMGEFVDGKPEDGMFGKVSEAVVTVRSV